MQRRVLSNTKTHIRVLCRCSGTTNPLECNISHSIRQHPQIPAGIDLNFVHQAMCYQSWSYISLPALGRDNHLSLAAVGSMITEVPCNIIMRDCLENGSWVLVTLVGSSIFPFFCCSIFYSCF
ncbi:hypothetical protein BDZ91DRAFT_715225 [Kalaharituber pfeilii]|nr:hypothetical protein BDZ91DRAFT_715225 [Kalaharituber pfeilii]